MVEEICIVIDMYQKLLGLKDPRELSTLMSLLAPKPKTNPVKDRGRGLRGNLEALKLPPERRK
jgi:hypothetical protein